MTISTQQIEKHGIIARALHWLTPLLLVYGYFRNGDVTGALTDPAAMTREIWFGLAVLVAFALRFIWMRWFNGGASRLSADAPQWERKASKLGHGAIYFFVAAIVLTGLSIPLAQSTGNSNLVGAAASFHEFITNVGVGLLAVHVVAALWHKLGRNDGIWESISAPRFNASRFKVIKIIETQLMQHLVPRLMSWYSYVRKFVPAFLR